MLSGWVDALEIIICHCLFRRVYKKNETNDLFFLLYMCYFIIKN